MSFAKIPLLLGTALLAALLACAPAPVQAAEPAKSLAAAKALQDAFADLAEKAFPSVVIIKARVERPQQAQRGRRMLPPWLQAPEQPQEGQEGVGMGSGFIISEDGYIITNHHVAGAATELRVVLHDGREVPAKRVGTDWKTDISVLKIDVKDKLPSLKFANSDKVRAGHWAVAIGAPYSFGYTLTTGVVSQKGRAVGLNQYEDYIQTDAAINPGNSGGPLLSIDGEVIGVNDFIVSGGGQGEGAGASGLAFAIPSNMAQAVAESIIKNGEVVRPWIGVSMQDIEPGMKTQLKAESGVLIKGVISGDPADKAGIEPGDIITKIGATQIKSSKELLFGILKYSPGEKIPFTALRDGAEKSFSVVAGRQRSDSVAGDDSGSSIAKAATHASLIASFGLSLAEGKGQVVIDKIEQGSPASLAGLRSGMTIYAVNRIKVSSVQEAERAAVAAGNAKRLLLYVDDGISRYFVPLIK